MFQRVSEFYSAGPIAGMEDGPFARWIDLSGGHDTQGLVTFQKPIVWLRQSTAQAVVLDVRGEVALEGIVHNDAYGFLKSIEGATENAVEMAEGFAAKSDSAIAVEVWLTVREIPAVSAPSPHARQGAPARFLSVPEDWCRPDDPVLKARATGATPQERAALPPPSFIRERVLFKAVTWSSRKTPQDWEQMRSDARARAYDGTLTAAA